MFYLFLLTGIVINTIFTLSTVETLLSWILLMIGFLISDYMTVVKDVETLRVSFDQNYATKMNEFKEQFMTAQIQKVKETADRAAARPAKKKG
jgi:uncharacterized membrane protein YqgA involved in biofilm formation